MASTTESPTLTKMITDVEKENCLLKEKVAKLEAEVEVSKKRGRDHDSSLNEEKKARRKLEDAIIEIVKYEMTGGEDAYFDSSMAEFVGSDGQDFLVSLGINVKTSTVLSFSADGREIDEIVEY